MANLSETPTYDAGVYQLETSDPLLGGADGVLNQAAKNLANRTAWLKQQIDPLAEDFDIDLNENGYLTLPAGLGGLTVQWGTYSVTPGAPAEVGIIDWSVTLPAEFTTACLWALAGPGPATVGYWDSLEHSVCVQTMSTTTLAGKAQRFYGSPSTSPPDTLTIHWLAIGY